MQDYHTKRSNAARTIPALIPLSIANVSPKNEAVNRLWIGLFLLAAVHVFTLFKLIETRHEARALRVEIITLGGDVTEHDEMLETLGDELTAVENHVGIDREAVQS